MRRGRKMLAFIVLLGVLSGLFCGCNDRERVSSSSQNGVARQIREIKDSNYIKIGVFRDNKPFSYLTENGEYQGFDVYFAKRIASDLGIKVEFVPVEADSRSEVLDTAGVDLVLANYSKAEDQSEAADFAMPYIKTSLGIISNAQDAVKDINALTDKLLIVVEGTAADLYFTNNYPEVKLIRLSSYDEAMDALEKGLGDAVCSNVLQLLAWQKDHAGFELGIRIPGTEQQFTPAVQKDNEELLEWLNEEIALLQKEGFFTRAYEECMQPIYQTTIQKDEVIIE